MSKAIVIYEAGGTEQLQLVDLPKPIPGNNEVLIKVKAISINPVDAKTRAGKAFYTKLKDENPLILGWDVSGIVESTGESVTEFSIGDEVFGMVNFPGNGKGYAEYVSAPADQLAEKPSNISHEEAAAATLAPLTAYQVLKKYVKPGDKVLIQSAAGGVGHYAVQIAKILGAHVTGTASGRNTDFVKSLGADAVIDYTKTAFEDIAANMDFVLDTMSGEVLRRSVKTVRNGGTIITLPSGADLEEALELAKPRGIIILNQLVQSNGADMKQLAAWLETRQLKSIVTETYNFEEMAKAHQSIETHKTRGKIVVVV